MISGERMPNSDELLIAIDKENLQCRLCQKKYKNFYMLNTHLNEHFPTFVCDDCGKGFATVKRWTHHKYRHNRDNKGNEHRIVSKTRKQLKAEINAVMDKDNKKCLMCEKIFQNCHMLSRHMNDHFKNYTCEECGKGFATQSRCQAHTRLHRRGVFKCRGCDKVFDTYGGLKNHGTIHVADLYACPHCEQRFSNFHFRQKHLKDEHGDFRKHQCEVCGFACLQAGRLATHVRKKHSFRVKSHACAECDKEFYELSTLRAHMIIHSGRKTFHCNVCSKAFLRKTSLIGHMKIHMAVKKFVCEHCGVAFVQKISLRLHLRKHENKDTFTQIEKR